MKLQQPRNYDFRVSQFDPPRSQSGNDHETTTSPPGHHWEANVALTTTAKLQQLRVNSHEMTTFAESCNDREMQRPWNDKLKTAQLRHICVRFCVTLWRLSFQVPFGSLWVLAWPPLQSLAVKKTFIFCKFWAVKNFYNLLKSADEKLLGGLRGANNFSVTFRIVFRVIFRVFQTVFRVKIKIYRGQFRSARVLP